MQIGTIGKALIAISAILMLYALSMPVAMEGSSMVNIHLLSQKNNTLIIAGVLFVGGIALFSVFKMKQTKDDELAKRQKDAEIRESAKNKIKEVASRSWKIEVPVSNYFAIKGATWKSSLTRLAIGLVSGVFIHDLLQGVTFLMLKQINEDNESAKYLSMWNLASNIALIGFVITVAYSFRSRPNLIILRNVLSCFLFLLVINWVCGYFGYMNSGYTNMFAIISMVCLVAIQFRLKMKRA